jgi:hypothetical protein
MLFSMKNLLLLSKSKALHSNSTVYIKNDLQNKA